VRLFFVAILFGASYLLFAVSFYFVSFDKLRNKNIKGCGLAFEN
jgi:hypothetical protein